MGFEQPQLPHMPPPPPAPGPEAARHPYTVLLDPITPAQARLAGRLMGSAGVTGRFVRGSLEEVARKEAAL